MRWKYRAEQAVGYPENWDSVKKLIPRQERMRELDSMEGEYLQKHPESGYLTEIIALKGFPDYIDYLPKGAIVRKIGVMGFVPMPDESITNPIVISREEFRSFVDDTAALALERMRVVLHEIGYVEWVG